MSEQKPTEDNCEYAEARGPLVLCSAPFEQSGASPAWKNRNGLIIVTPPWCQAKCLLKKEQAASDLSVPNLSVPNLSVQEQSAGD